MPWEAWPSRLAKLLPSLGFPLKWGLQPSLHTLLSTPQQVGPPLGLKAQTLPALSPLAQPHSGCWPGFVVSQELH